MSDFELPAKIERCLAALSNAQIRVNAGYRYQFALPEHALYLTVPESIYVANARQRQAIEEKIAGDLNRLHNVPGEHRRSIPGDGSPERMAVNFGLLVTGTRQVSEDATKRLWEEGDFRLFMTHKSEVKREAKKLKDILRYYGVSAFVAHEDIHPTKAWQDEIENVLATMDGFVALMTLDFHDSDWTDQEVGYALARGVPIIALRLERDPYGFLGKFQALTCDWESAPEGIVKLLVENHRMLSAYIRALGKCPSFDMGNTLSRILPSIELASEEQVDEMIDAFNKNGELQGSYGFRGSKAAYYGGGLCPTCTGGGHVGLF